MFLFRWLGVVNFWTGKCINFQGKRQPVAVSPPMGPQNVGALVLKGWLERRQRKGEVFSSSDCHPKHISPGHLFPEWEGGWLLAALQWIAGDLD